MGLTYAYTKNSSLKHLAKSVHQLERVSDAVYSDWCSNRDNIDDRQGITDLLHIMTEGDSLYLPDTGDDKLSQSKYKVLYGIAENRGVNILQLHNGELTA